MNFFVGIVIGFLMVAVPPFLIFFIELPDWASFLWMFGSIGFGTFCLLKYWIPYTTKLDVKEWQIHWDKEIEQQMKDDLKRLGIKLDE